MSYPYSEENRLIVPAVYMYAPYLGKAFIESYVSNRKERLAFYSEGRANCSLNNASEQLSHIARRFHGANSVQSFDTKSNIVLRKLLAVMLGELSAGKFESVEHWISKLVQRFEVNKKLYETYAPGFRGAYGNECDVACYAELALVLALAFKISGKVQYLSTLLKLIDLLLSIDKIVFNSANFYDLMVVLIASELEAVCTIAKKQGVFINAF